jgi:hypothetical protein
MHIPSFGERTTISERNSTLQLSSDSSASALALFPGASVLLEGSVRQHRQEHATCSPKGLP